MVRSSILILLSFIILAIASPVFSRASTQDLGLLEGARAGASFLNLDEGTASLLRGVASDFGDTGNATNFTKTAYQKGFLAGLTPSGFGSVAGAQTEQPPYSFSFSPEVYLGISFLLFIFSCLLYSINVMPLSTQWGKGQPKPANEQSAQQS